MRITNTELAPKIHHLLIENPEWNVRDAIEELSTQYIIDKNRYNAIASTYSRWKRNNHKSIIDINDTHTLIKLISLENVENFVRKYHYKDKAFEQVLSRLTKDNRPYNEYKRLIKAIRAMLMEQFEINQIF